MTALRQAHLEADHRLAAGDTSDLLPGIDPAKAVETAKRIIRSDYHDGCSFCAGIDYIAPDGVRWHLDQQGRYPVSGKGSVR